MIKDHSRRLAVVHMSIAAATHAATVGVAVVNASLVYALEFNLGRDCQCGKDGGRTVAQEALLWRATIEAMNRVARGSSVFYTKQFQEWCLRDAARKLAPEQAREDMDNLDGETCEQYEHPVLDDLKQLVRLTDRCWVYCGLLEARADGASHGYQGGLARETFAGNGNRQQVLSKAKRALAEVFRQLDAANAEQKTNKVSAFLGRLEQQFATHDQRDISRMLKFLSDDLRLYSHGSEKYGEAWAVLKFLADQDDKQRAALIAALGVYEEACDGLAAWPQDNPLQTWLGSLPAEPAGQHPPSRPLAYLRIITPKQEPAEHPARVPLDHRRRLQARLVVVSSQAGAWQNGLLAELQKDCTRENLYRWALQHVQPPLAWPDADHLREAVRERIEVWARYAACPDKRKVPPSLRLLPLEMPEQHAWDAGRLGAAAQALTRKWPDQREFASNLGEVIVAAVLSVRLDDFAELVRQARRVGITRSVLLKVRRCDVAEMVGTFLHPVFDPRSNYRAASRESVWGKDRGASGVKRLFHDLLQHRYLMGNPMAHPTAVPANLFPPGVYELHYREWEKQGKKVTAQAGVSAQTTGVKDRPAPRREDVIGKSAPKPVGSPWSVGVGYSSLWPSLESRQGALESAGSSPTTYRYAVATPEVQGGPAKDLEYTGSNVHERLRAMYRNTFAITTAIAKPNRRWLMLLVPDSLLVELGRVVSAQPEADVLKETLARMILTPSDARDATRRRTAFTLSLLLSQARGLEGTTDATGQVRNASIDLDFACPVVPTDWTVLFCEGPPVFPLETSS